MKELEIIEMPLGAWGDDRTPPFRVSLKSGFMFYSPRAEEIDNPRLPPHDISLRNIAERGTCVLIKSSGKISTSAHCSVTRRSGVVTVEFRKCREYGSSEPQGTLRLVFRVLPLEEEFVRQDSAEAPAETAATASVGSALAHEPPSPKAVRETPHGGYPSAPESVTAGAGESRPIDGDACLGRAFTGQSAEVHSTAGGPLLDSECASTDPQPKGVAGCVSPPANVVAKQGAPPELSTSASQLAAAVDSASKNSGTEASASDGATANRTYKEWVGARQREWQQLQAQKAARDAEGARRIRWAMSGALFSVVVMYVTGLLNVDDVRTTPKWMMWATSTMICTWGWTLGASAPREILGVGIALGWLLAVAFSIVTVHVFVGGIVVAAGVGYIWLGRRR